MRLLLHIIYLLLLIGGIDTNSYISFREQNPIGGYCMELHTEVDDYGNVWHELYEIYADDGK